MNSRVQGIGMFRNYRLKKILKKMVDRNSENVVK